MGTICCAAPSTLRWRCNLAIPWNSNWWRGAPRRKRHFASNRASARWSRSGLPATRVSPRRRVCSLLFGSSGRNGWFGFRFRRSWMRSPEWCSEGERTAGAKKGGPGPPRGPGRGPGVRPTKRVCLIEFLLEAQGAEAEYGDSVYRHGGHLRPQDVHPRAFQEDAADDLDEVAYRVQIGQILHRHGHVADGKC